MRHDKLKRELELLILLTRNTDYTVQDLCKALGVTTRNLYYYLEFLRDAGFEVIKHGYYYRLGRHSKFFMRLREGIDFTENEAVFIRRLLERADKNNPLVPHLQAKLDRFYDFHVTNDPQMLSRSAHNVEKLIDAIKFKSVVRLRDYSSPHSCTVTDRFVEPFELMNGNNDVRCYEILSGMNKTFKVARMRDVEIVDAAWGNEARHRRVFTDVFMFSGEERFGIDLLLGQLSCNLFTEEYPQAANNLVPASDSRWHLHLDVCSYTGIGRFVLGLYDDIEVLGDTGFQRYLKAKIHDFQTKSAHSIQRLSTLRT